MASVRVAVRVRPMNRREKDLNAKNIINMEGTKTSITNLKIPEDMGGGDSMRERTKTFTYDFSYDSTEPKNTCFISQEKVFVDLGSDVLRSAFEGYNACIFAYGQTGSGKSYTMMGNPGDAGLIPRICEGLFSRIAGTTRWDEASFRTEVSYLEIYNERVRDLLRRKSSQTYNLRVREHPKDGPYVEDLSKHLVQNYRDVEDLMEGGNINRTTASTGMNDVSSRSHAIFTVNFTQAKFDSEMPCETVSKIHLVDLAGSERADASGASGLRLKEGGNINKSLVTLGNVISSLADLSQGGVHVSNQRKRCVFVPYRDSVLTWLLKDSLGGNSKTIMIATVSPADVNYGETLSTLRYANRAKNIINKPTVNEDGNVRLIRELRAEILRLKNLLVQGNQISLLDSPTALSMEEKLQQNEARVLELTKEWTNKWNETQNILKEETLALRKEGIGVILDSELPHLIGIDDDLLSTGIILYHLKEGRTYVGREDASTEQDIILHGLDLDSEHCVFDNQNGNVTLVPLPDATCSVNGVTVTMATPLNQGAVILLGRTNMFRFNHPKEAARLREKRKSGLLSTFSLSMSDLSQSCENLSTVMLYNPGLEFERQQREELDKLEQKRRMVKQMELKQQSEKEELQRLQREVEVQRRESEEVRQRVLRQEESLRMRSQDMELRLRDLLAQKERFEQERQQEVQERGRQRHKEEDQIYRSTHQEEDQIYRSTHQDEDQIYRSTHQDEDQIYRSTHQDEDQIYRSTHQEEDQIYKELQRLRKESEEQEERLEAERRRLDEQEKEQVGLVGRLEEALRERHLVAEDLLTHEEAVRLEQERRALQEIREQMLRAKEQEEDHHQGAPQQDALDRYTLFKSTQRQELVMQEEALSQAARRLEREVASERTALLLLARGQQENDEEVRQAERRLTQKDRQPSSLSDRTLEDTHRTVDLVERRRSGNDLPPGGDDVPSGNTLDATLYAVEKELEETEERLRLHSTSRRTLQQLQDSYQFTANVARQEEKVRSKEKEILASRGEAQRAAMEQAVERLERRHSALRRGTSSLEGTRGPVAAPMRTPLSLEAPRGPAAAPMRTPSSLEGPRGPTAPPMEQDRVERELRQLRQSLSDVEGQSRTLHDGDDRINAYIEEEVQRRLNLLNGDTLELSLSSESIREEEDVSDCSSVRLTDEDDDNALQSHALQSHAHSRKLKYEQHLASVPLGTGSGPVGTGNDVVRISIPRYVLRGQGKDQHFEFEVKISVLDETWTVFRRYSRFREMHKSLKSKYPQLAALEFPPKKLFGNRDERMVAERRSHLERYLRRFFQVMLSSGASPLRSDATASDPGTGLGPDPGSGLGPGLCSGPGPGLGSGPDSGLSKHSICDFSPFFKKGVFDYSSHGTG